MRNNPFEIRSMTHLPRLLKRWFGTVGSRQPAFNRGWPAGVELQRGLADDSGNRNVRLLVLPGTRVCKL